MSAQAQPQQAPPTPPPNSTPVHCNVYSLMKKGAADSALGVVGFGAYHAGIEINNAEWSFGMDMRGRVDPNIDGIFNVPPAKAVSNFKESVLLGYVSPKMSDQDVLKVLAPLRVRWRCVTYHILNHNCTHFCLEFARALNPEFEKTFPHYCYRAANVGDTVLPDAVIAKIVKLAQPPPAIPPELHNKITVDFQGSAPAALPASVVHQTPPAKKSGGALGLFKSVASTVSGVVASGVGVVASELEKRDFAQKFPELSGDKLVDVWSLQVVHCFREQAADLFISNRNIAFSGDLGVHVIKPLTAIKSMRLADRTPPPANGLPPTFAPISDAQQNGGVPTALLIFFTDNTMIPVFNVKLVGETTKSLLGITHRAPVLRLMQCIDSIWREAGGK